MSITLTFGAVATPPAVGGSWAGRISQYGRIGAVVLLTAAGSAIPVNSGGALQKVETIAESGGCLGRGVALRVVLHYS